ncbi:MAG: hypothetical protein ABSA26_15275, partial [Thermoguttaceae bacterium]
MRRILPPGWLILVLCISVSMAQTETDKSGAETSQAKTGQAEQDKTKDKEDKEADKSQSESEVAKQAAKKSKVVCITLRGEYPEGPTSADLFSDMRPSLSDIIGRIDSAGKDKDVAAVWIKLEGLSVGRGKIN